MHEWLKCGIILATETPRTLELCSWNKRERERERRAVEIGCFVNHLAAE
jgi:hypothetical protein